MDEEVKRPRQPLATRNRIQNAIAARAAKKKNQQDCICEISQDDRDDHHPIIPHDDNREDHNDEETVCMEEESDLKLKLGSLVEKIMGYAGYDEEDCAPDNFKSIKHACLSRIMTVDPFFAEEVESEDPSSGDIAGLTDDAIKWSKIFEKFDSKKLEENGINGNKRKGTHYQTGGDVCAQRQR